MRVLGSVFLDEVLFVLGHPIRRRILERLWEKDCSFGELLDICGDSGKLGFHLRKMKNLVEHDTTRRVFQLNTQGRLIHEFLAHGLFTLQRAAESLERTERETRQQRTRFRTLFNTLPDPVVIIDQEGKILTLNDTLEEITGYRRQELLGKNILKIKIFTPKSRGILRSNLKLTMRGIDIPPYQVEAVKKDSSQLFFEVSCAKTEYRGKPAELLVFRDLTERKRLEEALRQSQERYRNLVEMAHDGIMLVKGPERTISFANRRMAEMLGYKVEELVNKRYEDLVHPDERQDYLEQKSRRLASGKPDIRERRLVKKDGTTLQTLLSISSLDPNDRTEQAPAICIFTDITEQKRIEEALRESEQNYRTLVELANEGIMRIDKKLKIKFINPRMAEILGRGPEELIGSNYLSLIPSEEHESVYENQRIMRQEKHAIRHERTLLRADGGRIHFIVSGTPLFNQKKEFTGYLGVFTDISSQKEVEATLRESEERFRAICSSVMDAVVLVDGEGKIIYWNPSAERRFGYSAEEAHRKELRIIIPKRLHEAYSKEFELFKRTGDSAAFGRILDSTAVRKDGREFPIKLSVSGFKVRGNWYATIIVRDITEQKRREDRERLLHDLLGHNLRNEIQGIRGYLKLLSRTKLSKRQREYVDNLLELCRGVSEQIDKIGER